MAEGGRGTEWHSTSLAQGHTGSALTFSLLAGFLSPTCIGGQHKTLAKAFSLD